VLLISGTILERIFDYLGIAFGEGGLEGVANRNWMGNTYEILYSFIFEFQYSYPLYPIVWFFRKIMFFGLILFTVYWSLKFIRHKDINYLLFLTLLIFASIIVITVFLVGTWWERFFPTAILFASCIIIFVLKYYNKKAMLIKYAVIFLLPLIFLANMQEAQSKEYVVDNFAAGNFLYRYTDERVIYHNVSSYGFIEFSEVRMDEGVEISEIRAPDSPRPTYDKSVYNILQNSVYTQTKYTMRSYHLDLSLKDDDFTPNEELSEIDTILASQNRIYDNGYSQVFSKE
jgi:hypothetical protein